MPVLRQDVNTGSPLLQLGETNYNVGTASPQVNQPQTEVDGRSAAISGFLQGFMGTFQPAIQKGQQRAQAQGIVDATQDPDALEDSSTAVGKQNIFMRDAYRQGYLGAAVQQSVTDFQAGVTDRATQAGLMGMSDADFLAQERQKNADLLSGLSSYLPHMSPESNLAVANALDNTKQSALNLLRKTRLGQAKVNNNRTVEQGSFQAQQNFMQQLEVDGPEAAYHFIQDQADLIGSNPIMEEKDKRQQIHNLFLSAAQNSNDPNVINFLAGKAAGVLGVTDPSLNSAMHSEWNRAGQQVAGATMMDLQDKLANIATLPPSQQGDARKNFEQSLVQANSTGYISTGQMLSLYDKVNKEQKPALQMKGLIQSVVQSGGGMSVEALHGAGGGAVTRDQIQSAIKEAYPDTLQGNIAMLASGQAGKDPWMIKTALSRVGSQMTDQLDTLSGQMEKVTDANGNVQYNIPQAIQQNITGFMAMYKGADDITKQTLMNTLPDDWKGVIQTAIYQNPSDANNNVLDTIKRVVMEKQSGIYNDVPAQPPQKALDTSGGLSWYQRINPFTTQSEESQRASFGMALQQEYANVYRSNRGMLAGKSPESINKMLTGMIQARTVPVQVGKFNTNVVLPYGTSLDQYAARAGVDSGTFTNALQSTIDSSVRGLGINMDNAQSVRILPQAGGAASSDFNLEVNVKNQAGVYVPQRISLPMNVIAQNAQTTYQAQLDTQRRDGENKAGANIATFYDHSQGGYKTLQVSGTNSTNLAPDLFNGIMANTMRYEGFKGTKSGGSVGYGWHDASGDSVPDSITMPEAQAKLKDLMQSRYIPMAQSYMKSAGIQGDHATQVLVDLAYQRPADASTLADRMGQFQNGDIELGDLVKTLKSLPSYTDAGGGAKTQRNIDRIDELRRWSILEAKQGANPRANPFGAF